MDPADEAVQTVVELEVLRARVERDRVVVASPVFPLLTFGALTLLSAGVVAVGGAGRLGLYWLVAATVGTVLTTRHFERAGARVGLRGEAGPRLDVAGALLAAAVFAAGFAAGPTGPSYVLAAGYALFPSLGADRRLAAVGLGLAALTLTLQLAGVGNAQVLPIALGSALLASGMVLRR